MILSFDSYCGQYPRLLSYEQAQGGFCISIPAFGDVQSAFLSEVIAVSTKWLS